VTEAEGSAENHASAGEADPDIDQVERLYAHPLIAREIFEGTPVGINLTDVEGRVLATNPAFARLVGRSPADLRKRTFDSITHPADRETDRSLFGELLAGRRDFYRIEKRYVRPDGRVVWVRLSVSLIRDGSGEPRFTVGVAEDITDRKEAETALQRSEARYRDLFEDAHDVVFTLDLTGKFTSINRAAEQVSGYLRDEARSMHFAGVVAPADVPKARSMIQEKLGAGGNTSYELTLVRKDGRQVLLELSTQLVIEDGAPVGIQGIGRDITEKRQAEERLRESERRFSDAFEHSPIGMALVGLDGRWLRVNRSLCDLLGYPEQELVQANIHDLTHPDDQEADVVILERILAGEGATAETEKRYFHRSGRIVWVRVKVTLVSRSDGTPWYFISQAQDLTEFKRTQDALHTLLEQQKASLEALEYAATHDSLTGLPNRSLFMDRLHHAVISARRQRATFSLLLLDLDGFKSVNDTYGHAAGDTCLIELARRLKVVLRGTDSVGRLGGDEFVILLFGANEVAARTVADKLRLLASMPTDLGGCEVELGTSVGIAVFPSMGDDARSLLHAADMAMYATKRQARSMKAKRPAREGTTGPRPLPSSSVL
jgi:diguanylate cyclase (GGDEF)-like protein/PAS domain S-box-containing protein